MNSLSELQKEQLSALLDGEVAVDELDAMQPDASLVRRYSITGEALRGRVSDASMIDVSAVVSRTIADEETYSVEPVTAFDRKKGGNWFDLGSLLRPVGGIAVAASVAVVMVLVVTQPQPDGTGLPAGGSIATYDSQPVVSLPVSTTTNPTEEALRKNEEEKRLLEQPEEGVLERQ